MCFSASASFGAAALLTFIGVASIKKTEHPKQFLFAAIPLIFAVQQLSEGILWLSLPKPDLVNIQTLATYTFLLFAQIIWPIWVPIAIMLLEKSATQKNTQKVLIGIGIAVGVYLAYCLLSFHVEAKIIGQHISYQQDYPTYFKGYGILFYALATIAPSFFSHLKRMWLLGTTILVSYIISVIFYQHYVLSVWCFFSSIISFSIYAIMVEISKAQKQSASLNNR